MNTFSLYRPTTTSHWLYYMVDIFNLPHVMTLLNITNLSLCIFCLSRPVFLIRTFPLLRHSSFLTCKQCAWPKHNFALPALPSLHFLILPPNGCSDAVIRPQIYAFGVSQCLAFPLVLSSHVPSSLSLALILYFWDSICKALTDGRVIFTRSLCLTYTSIQNTCTSTLHKHLDTGWRWNTHY